MKENCSSNAALTSVFVVSPVFCQLVLSEFLHVDQDTAPEFLHVDQDTVPETFHSCQSKNRASFLSLRIAIIVGFHIDLESLFTL